MAWGVARLAQLHGISRSKALWLVALNPLVLMHFIVGVHNDALMVGLITVAFVLALERKPAAAAVLIGMAGAVKPIGLLVLPFIGIIWSGPTGRVLVPGGQVGLVRPDRHRRVRRAQPHHPHRPGLAGRARHARQGAYLAVPATAVGMVVGQVGRWTGLFDVDAAVAAMRMVGQLIALAFIAWLVLAGGPIGHAGGGLALMATVFLGRSCSPGTCCGSAPCWWRPGCAVMSSGSCCWNVVADAACASHLELHPGHLPGGVRGPRNLLVAAIITLVMFTSPRERRLLLGAPGDPGLLPDNPVAAGVAASRIITGPGACRSLTAMSLVGVGVGAIR